MLSDNARHDKEVGEITGGCTCHDGYKSRGLKDPQCQHCDLYFAINELIEGNKKLIAERDKLKRALSAYVDALENMDDAMTVSHTMVKAYTNLIHKQALEGE